MRNLIGILGHELMKVWNNKKFLIFITSIFVLNLGTLWYSTSSNDYNPDLYSYRKLESKLKNFNDDEKIDYIEKYLDNLNEESKLLYTDNYMKETSLLKEVLNEIRTVKKYNTFLDNIQEQSSILSNVSIFQSSSGNEYSDRNIIKTANDYKQMNEIMPSYENSKGILLATNSYITDIFIILILCIVIYILVFYEKEKNLFSVIRVNINGRLCTGICKLLSLQISCILITLLFYGSNLVYYFSQLPIPDLSQLIQCLAPFSTSTLEVSIGMYLIIYILGKAVVVSIIASTLLLISIWSNYIFTPYLALGFMSAVSYGMWKLIYPTTKWEFFKYFNLVGLLDMNKVFGAYLNLNIFNVPINYSRVWIVFVIISLIVLNILIVISYLKMRKLSVKSIKLKGKEFNVHTSLFRHEVYKILIMKKGIVILLLFLIGTGYIYTNHRYYISSGELTYKQYMDKLEGPLTKDKEEYLKNEKKKYEQAITMCNEIDEKYNNMEITKLQAMNLKQEYERVLSNYSIFETIWEKYEFIKKYPESEFIYDSGYKILFQAKDNTARIVMILYFVAIVFTLSSVLPMEYSNSQNKILKPTLLGMKKITYTKIAISSILAILFMIVTVGGRFIHISKFYEMSSLGAKAISLFGIGFWGSKLSIATVMTMFFIGLLIFSILVMGIILLISSKVKNSVYTIVISFVLISLFLIL